LLRAQRDLTDTRLFSSISANQIPKSFPLLPDCGKFQRELSSTKCDDRDTQAEGKTPSERHQRKLFEAIRDDFASAPK
jgi:hypothetical protein